MSGRTLLLFLFLFLLNAAGFAQPKSVYSVRNGRMYVQIPREISPDALDSFVVQFDLGDLDLKTLLRTAITDSLKKLGWRLEETNERMLVISKGLEPFTGLHEVDDKIFALNKPSPIFPAVNNGVVLGVNRFRNKASFYRGGATVRFFLRGYQSAQRVHVAGSFNNWKPSDLLMQKTDSGWIFEKQLDPGKYWYKFIVDGNWIVDKDNLLSENDGRGNVNSVFFRPNVNFALAGFANAKKVTLAGSFNNWQKDGLLLQRTADGWELPLYLAEGTHTYKFIVDGKWMQDEKNPASVADGQGGFNSVIRLGKQHLFQLAGYANANRVMLTGSFNQWRNFEWEMKKTATGWELPFTLGPGNYEYKFQVDGKWISDPANPLFSTVSGNSYLVMSPNYTFRLKGMPEAKKVFLAGDFNGWDPAAYPMKREGADWIFPVHLSAGKHVYKFVVDGKWIKDPDNKLWEQNEFSTGNSVLWIEQ